MTKEKTIKKARKSIVACAACLVIMFGCVAGVLGGLWKQTLQSPATDQAVATTTLQSPATDRAVATTITLDVNPSIEIQANEVEEVLKVVALNADAEIVLGNMELEGTALELTVNALVGSMLRNGYINETTNSVLLSVDSKDEATGNEVKDRLSAEISKLINTETIHGSVIGQIVSGEDQELSALAAQYGMSIGKAKLIQTIVSMSSGREFSNYTELTITQLNAVMTASVKTPDTDAPYIGEEKALEIALRQCNLTEEELSCDPIVELVASRGEICYQILLRHEWKDGSGSSSASYVVHVNAFTGKAPGEGVTAPNFSMKEAWEIVCDQLGDDGEKAVMTSYVFHDMESALPMTYSFAYEVGNRKYAALVDAMDGTVIRIVQM